MNLLYGKTLADEILANLKNAILKQEKKPSLAVVLVGNDKASQIYVKLKEKAAKEIGVEFFKYLMAETEDQEEILNLIDFLNKDEEINGIIVQLPLPVGFETEKIITTIDPQKDIDGFQKENAKKFLKGEAILWPVFPLAIIRLIEQSKENLINKKAIVIANSAEFGKIMSAALQQKKIKASYILAKDVSFNFEKIKTSDIVVSAVGSPGLIKGEMLKKGAIVIDGGIEKVGKKVLGDVNFASTENNSGFLTPVPGGVGPMTIACLLENVYKAFKAQQK